MKTPEEIKNLTAKANFGDAQAQNDLGCAYGDGDGAPMDRSIALSWLLKSAEQGNAQALYNCGIYFKSGYGTVCDYHKAIHFLEEAFKNGNIKAALEIGNIFKQGYIPSPAEISQGVRRFNKSPKDALYWYSRALSLEEGKMECAQCYEYGIGTEINLRKAYALYQSCSAKVASQHLDRVLKKYIPNVESRLQTISLLGENPFRILGIPTNASTREIKAAQSKITAFNAVGKHYESKYDDLLPQTITGRINIIEKHLSGITRDNNVPGSQAAKEAYNADKRAKNELDNLKNSLSQLDAKKLIQDKVTRDQDSVTSAINRISSPHDKAKFGLFWFCLITPEDGQAADFLIAGKWDAAIEIWRRQQNFSSLINLSVLNWYSHNDIDAIQYVLTVIRANGYRQQFLEAIGLSPESFTEDDLAVIFWDALYSEFPESERYFEWYEIGSKLEYKEKPGAFCEKDNAYLVMKALAECSSSFHPLIKAAKMPYNSDLEDALAHNEILYNTCEQYLYSISLIIGKNDYRYINLCDEIALTLLEFAIAYNNHSNSLGAAGKALKMAEKALDIAISDHIKERCSNNIEIFDNNKKIASAEEFINIIDKIFTDQEQMPPSIRVASIMLKEAMPHLERLKSKIGINDPLYVNFSSVIVNRILNVIIKTCNSDPETGFTRSTVSLCNQLENLVMDNQTRQRFAQNRRIICNSLVITPVTSGTYIDYHPTRKYVNAANSEIQHPYRQIAIYILFGCVFIAFLIGICSWSISRARHTAGASSSTPYVVDNQLSSPSSEANSHMAEPNNTTISAEAEPENDYYQWINNRLTTGSRPYSSHYGRPLSGENEFRFITSSGNDYVILIKRSRDNQYVDHKYVRGGDRVTITVPDGSYVVFLYSGKGWNPNKSVGACTGGFVSNESFQKDGPVTMTTSIRGDYYYNQTCEYTLYPVQNGNLLLESSNPNEAFN